MPKQEHIFEKGTLQRKSPSRKLSKLNLVVHERDKNNKFFQEKKKGCFQSMAIHVTHWNDRKHFYKNFRNCI